MKKLYLFKKYLAPHLDFNVLLERSQATRREVETVLKSQTKRKANVRRNAN